MLYCLTASSHERGHLLPTALIATEPLTPLSQARFFILTPLSPSRELQLHRTSCSSQGWYGSEDVEPAKIIVHAVS